MELNKTRTTSEQAISRFTRLLTFLISPHSSVQDIGERARAQLLGIVTLILSAVYSWALIVRSGSFSDFIALLFITILAYTLSRTPYYQIGIYLFCFSFTAFAYITLLLGTANSFSSAITTSVHVSLVVASLLLPPRGLVALVIFVAMASFTAPLYSKVPVAIDSDFYKDSGVAISIGLVLIGATVFRSFIEGKRIEQINQANRELEDLTTNLEQRVNERTVELENANAQIMRRAAQLKAVTELSESISQVQNLSDLFPAITKLISERFGFYHVGIFLLDQDREYAVLQAANSEGGKEMLARDHRLRLGVGVVGFCAQAGQPRIALDVGADAVFFNNPDLPNTRSEVALPIFSRGETIGVLDVQSTEAGAFSWEDLQVLTALANQVSIAMENARLLMETRAALVQVQEVYNEFTRTAWSRTVTQMEQRGFRFQSGRIEMLEEDLQSPEVTSAVASGEVKANQTNGILGKHASMAVPVKLRGEVIGVLHVEANDSQKHWQNDEISLVQAVAERAAFAMENARLFQDARRRATKERLISEASARISSALNVENILQATAEELERVLGGSEILIQFQDKEQP
ncbi:MAG TPA: GAF domain-containing protein [Anaerolineales bacterium]|jgi:GAF domain-containing protein|nr:GAF domain-containing protein [Anaerolineales bacterium]